jgi:aspartate/methionine/tyrosine aminotransferase
VRVESLEINGPSKYGYPPLLERLAKKNAVTPDCVVAAEGTSMANYFAMAATFEPGEEVLFESPTYEVMESTARYLGADIKRFERRFENGFRVDPDEVKRQITPRTRLVVIANMHNPSSVLTDDTTLRAVSKIAAGVGARVLVDEVYLEAIFDQPVRSSFHLGDNFVVTNSLTKGYGLSGLRCGWVLAQPDLAQRMWRLADLHAGTMVHPGELLSVIALDNLPAIARRAKSILDANRPRMEALLDEHPELQCVRPQFGTIYCPQLPRGSVEEFCQLLRDKYETSVVPGHFFYLPQHFRVGLGGDPEMTAAGLERLDQALSEYLA